MADNPWKPAASKDPSNERDQARGTWVVHEAGRSCPEAASLSAGRIERINALLKRINEDACGDPSCIEELMELTRCLQDARRDLD